MKSLLAGLLFIAASSVAFCQGGGSIWKQFERPDVGGGILFYSIATDDSVATNNVESRLNLANFGIMAGLNFPVISLADNLTIGINPNLEFSVSLLSTTDYWTGEAQSLGFTFESPDYLTIKYGTDATWTGSRSVFGASAGIGCQATLFNFGENFYSYVVPSFMAEINFGKRRSSIGLIKLRYSAQIGSHNERIAYDDGTESKLVFTNHAIHLIFTPGY